MRQDAEIVEFFDGKEDRTLIIEKHDCKSYISKKLKDHYVLVGEPDTIYPVN